MAKLPRSGRRYAALLTAVLPLTTAAAIAAFAPASLALAAPAARTTASAGSHAASPAAAPVRGTIGSYSLIKLTMTITEPAYTTKWGTHVSARNLLTVLRYPALPTGSAPQEFPLIVFAPGYRQCDSPNYVTLLRSIASAGYVVAAVNFPRTDCKPTGLSRADLINEPHDMSYAITALLALSSASTGPLAGLIDPGHIGALGHSDGGVVVSLLTANTCCTDHRVSAAAIDAGAEWPSAHGSYYAHHPNPLLFEQGSADAINNPLDSVIMYDDDPSLDRYYLDLVGASHTSPVWGNNPTEQRNALVTTDFFDKWLLGLATDAKMRSDGTKAGVAIFRSGSQPAP